MSAFENFSKLYNLGETFKYLTCHGLVLYNSNDNKIYTCEYCRSNYNSFMANCKNCGGTVK